MNAASIDIKNMLVIESAKSHGDITEQLIFAENLFIGREPASPDRTVTIFDTSVEPPLETVSKGWVYVYDGIQLRIRDRDYATGWDLANQIKTFLHERANEVWGGMYYCLITCSGNPAFLEWDDNERCKFVVNFRIQRRKE